VGRYDSGLVRLDKDGQWQIYSSASAQGGGFWP